VYHLVGVSFKFVDHTNKLLTSSEKVEREDEHLLKWGRSSSLLKGVNVSASVSLAQSSMVLCFVSGIPSEEYSDR